jgi:HSP20 family molecular chaperone IbpA
MTEKTIEIEKQETETTEKTEQAQPRRRYAPKVDIYEVDNEIIMAVDMPGVGEEQVDITLEKNILTIQGIVDPVSLAGHTIKYREYGEGNYRRAFALSEEINRDSIEATMANGVLRLTLPKIEEAKARKIMVRAE